MTTSTQRVLLVVSWLASSFFVSAQTNSTLTQSSLDGVVNGRMVRSYDERLKGLEGSVTLLKNFVPGKVYLPGKQVLIHDQFNYDAYSDQLLVIKDNEEMVISTKLAQRFALKDPQGDSLFFTKLTVDGSTPGYVQVLADFNNVKLYKKITKQLQRPSSNSGYGSSQPNYELLTSEKLLMWTTGQSIAVVKNKKQVLDYFPNQKEQIQQFMKEAKTDFKNEKDLALLFRKISELVGP